MTAFIAFESVVYHQAAADLSEFDDTVESVIRYRHTKCRCEKFLLRPRLTRLKHCQKKEQSRR